MAKARFQVVNTHTAESVATIEMDDDLLKAEANIVDMRSLTLRHIRNGGNYTIVPIDDHTISILARVYEVYNNVTKKPSPLFSTSVHRMDDLIQVVGLMFGEIEYIVIEGKDDLDKIINPPKEEYEPKKVKYTVLGDLLQEAKKKAGITEEEGHVHGPDCKH